MADQSGHSRLATSATWGSGVPAGSQRSSPEFRASGILGPEAMWQTFRGNGLPDHDLEAQEVLRGVAAVADTGLVDSKHTFVIGHSYGAYLLNRIVTTTYHPFQAAVCWEGLADLRLLADVSLQMQTRWRGGSPDALPEAWAAASPVERAEQSACRCSSPTANTDSRFPHGEAWLAALRRHGVPSEYVVYPDEGHTLTDPANESDLLDRAQAWFRSAIDYAPRPAPSLLAKWLGLARATPARAGTQSRRRRTGPSTGLASVRAARSRCSSPARRQSRWARSRSSSGGTSAACGGTFP